MVTIVRNKGLLICHTVFLLIRRKYYVLSHTMFLYTVFIGISIPKYYNKRFEVISNYL